MMITQRYSTLFMHLHEVNSKHCSQSSLSRYHISLCRPAYPRARLLAVTALLTRSGALCHRLQSIPFQITYFDLSLFIYPCFDAMCHNPFQIILGQCCKRFENCSINTEVRVVLTSNFFRDSIYLHSSLGEHYGDLATRTDLARQFWQMPALHCSTIASWHSHLDNGHLTKDRSLLVWRLVE
jgi:hypothetical protein